MKGRGNVNMRGKLAVVLLCRCCVAWDGRIKCRDKEAERAIRRAIKCENAD
jgi:hypothetical protein